MKVSKCKGMIDLLPGDMARFRHIESVFRQACIKRGYGEIRTPTLEYLYLFTSSGTLTPAMLNRVYSFLDWDGWSGERVVLRPEGTIPTARLYLENLQIGSLARLFYVENSLSFEETGTKRRERWQCSAELIGSDQPLADAELVLLALEVLGDLGIGPVTVSLSHAGLIKTLLEELGLGTVEQTEVFDRVLEGDIRALGEVKTDDAELGQALSLLLDVKGNSPGFLRNVKAVLGKSPSRFRRSLDDLAQIAELLSAMDCAYEIDLASGRGFEYYTGVMFQFHAAERLGGGGRYNDLIPLEGGPSIPASGFALSMDRLMCLVQLVERSPERVLVKPEARDVAQLKTCLQAARALREAGYIAELDLGQQGQMEYRWLLSVSTDGSFRLTNAATGRERKALSQERVLRMLREAK